MISLPARRSSRAVPRALALVLALALALAASGCADGWAVPPEMQAAIQQKLQRLPDIAEISRTHPVLDGVTIFGDAPPNVWKPYRFAKTPLVTLGEALEFPTRQSTLFRSISPDVHDRLLWHCHDLAQSERIVATRGPCSDDGDWFRCRADARARADACADLDAVFVVRFHEFLEPKLVDTTYDGGYARGELLLFDLDHGRLFCGAPFEAESGTSPRTEADLVYGFGSDIQSELRAGYEACQKAASP